LSAAQVFQDYKLMLRSQRLMIALDAFFVPEAQQTLASGGAIAQPPETTRQAIAP
jgi:hypothetical protein